MTSVSHQGNTVLVDGITLSMPYAIREAFMLDDRIIVLLDPDSYLTDPSYGRERRRGDNPLRNLFALSRDGKVLWEAAFPEKVDYFYRIVSRSPLTALSFSSFRCEIDPQTGMVVGKTFLK